MLFLAEVALGRQYQAREAEKLTYDTIQAEKKSDSLHGVGRMASPEQFYETMCVRSLGFVFAGTIFLIVDLWSQEGRRGRSVRSIGCHGRQPLAIAVQRVRGLPSGASEATLCDQHGLPLRQLGQLDQPVVHVQEKTTVNTGHERAVSESFWSHVATCWVG